jgi:hypothetical protein
LVVLINLEHTKFGTGWKSANPLKVGIPFTIPREIAAGLRLALPPPPAGGRVGTRRISDKGSVDILFIHNYVDLAMYLIIGTV